MRSCSGVNFVAIFRLLSKFGLVGLIAVI